VEGTKGIQKVFEHESALIVDEVEVGPDPSAIYEPTSDGSMLIDPAMKWMVDFDEAVACGMAMRVPLTGAAVNGLALLVVVGVARQWRRRPAILARVVQLTIMPPGCSSGPASTNITDPGVEEESDAGRDDA
jgi:hypothetical protein